MIRNPMTIQSQQDMLEEKMEEKYASLERCGVLYFEYDPLEKMEALYGKETADKAYETVAKKIYGLRERSLDVYDCGRDGFLVVGADYSKEQIRNLAREWIEEWEGFPEYRNNKEILLVGMAWDCAPVSLKNLMVKAVGEMLSNRTLIEEGIPLDYCAHGEISSSFGLLTRKQFFKNVDFRLKNSIGRYCMVAIDIEHFKLFNMWHGRSAGDDLLTSFAAVLRDFEARYDGIATYLGGDDFVIFMPESREVIASLEETLIQVAMGKVNAAGFLPALGVYPIEDKSMDVMDMYDCALEALTEVIGHYEKRVCYYEKNMISDMKREIDIVVAAREALKNDEFQIYLQPQVRINSSKIVGAEALVRWISPTKGMISPGEFIPALEKNGFIGEVDQCVWELACKKIRGWIDEGLEPIPISINVSRIDILTFNTVSFLNHLIDKYQLDRKYLKIEITESAYVENEGKVYDTIKELRKFGYTLMMDDFGSGYSSLNMLREAIVDIIKIDMRFLDMEDDNLQKGISILKSVIAMTNEISMPIVIEGVETKQQADFLQDLGVRFAQGYLYFRPMPTDAFEELIRQEEKVDHRGIYSKDIDVAHLNEAIEKLLANRNERYKKIAITKTRGGFFEYEALGDQRLISVSQSVAYMFGCDTVEEFREYVGDSFIGMVHPEDRERVQMEINNQISGSEWRMDYIEYRIVRKSGEVRYVYDYGHLEEQRDAQMPRFYVFLLDVTDRIR